MNIQCASIIFFDDNGRATAGDQKYYSMRVYHVCMYIQLFRLHRFKMEPIRLLRDYVCT